MEREVVHNSQYEYFRLLHGETVNDSNLNAARPLVEMLLKEGTVIGQRVFSFDSQGEVKFDTEWSLADARNVHIDNNHHKQR